MEIAGSGEVSAYPGFEEALATEAGRWGFALVEPGRWRLEPRKNVMDEFTRALARIAYDSLWARRRDKSQPASVPDLEVEIGRHWIVYRNGWIAQESARILSRSRPERLADLVDCLWDHLARYGEFWEYPDWDCDDPRSPDEPGPCCPLDPEALRVCAEWSAWAIAALRWLHLELRDQAPRPRYTPADLVDWLTEVQPVQLTLGL